MLDCRRSIYELGTAPVIVRHLFGPLRAAGLHDDPADAQLGELLAEATFLLVEAEGYESRVNALLSS